MLQYTKASDAKTRWIVPASPIAVIKGAKLDSANEPVLPKSVAAVLHVPREPAA